MARRAPASRKLCDAGITPSSPTSEWEIRFGHPGLLVVGVDEVGRGCLAGPVVAGAAILGSLDPAPEWLTEVNDSKLLKPETRERLAPLIRGWAKACAIGIASVEEIDRLNIHHASHLAMQRAFDSLGVEAAHVLVDGKFVPKSFQVPGTALVKGDSRSLSIACAAILAKVWRDSHMGDLDLEYPGYGFSAHKGYFTPAHRRALATLGPCGLHRRSFSPVAALL